MLGLDDDDDDVAPQPGLGKTALKSLFAMNDAGKQQGNDTFKWQKEKKKKETTQAAAAAAPNLMHRCGVQLFRSTSQGYQLVGAAMAVLMYTHGGVNNLICFDQQKKTLLASTLGSSFVITLGSNENDQNYATISDDNGMPWSICFRTVADGIQFAHYGYLGKYFSCGRDKHLFIEDLAIGSGNALTAGDTIAINIKSWKVEMGDANTTPKLGICFDESEEKKLEIGDGTLMKGIDDALRGMKKSGKRLAIFSAVDLLVTPNTPSMQHPVATPGSTIAFYIEIVKVKKEKLPSTPSSSNGGSSNDLKDRMSKIGVAGPMVQAAPTPYVAADPAFSNVAPPPPPPADIPNVPVITPQPMPTINPQMNPYADFTNAAYLLNQMHMPLALGMHSMMPPFPNIEPTPPPAQTSSTTLTGSKSDELLERLVGKVNRMNDKIDRLDLTSQLAVNNTLLIQSVRQIMRDLYRQNNGTSTDREDEEYATKASLNEAQVELATTKKLLERKCQELENLKAELETERESTEHRIKSIADKYKTEKSELKAKFQEKLQESLLAEYQRGMADATLEEHREDRDLYKGKLQIEVEQLKQELEECRSALRFEQSEKSSQLATYQALIAKHESAREAFKDRERQLVERMVMQDQQALAHQVYARKLKKAMNGEIEKCNDFRSLFWNGRRVE